MADHEPYLWSYEIEKATGEMFDWRCPLCNKLLSDGKYQRGHVIPYAEKVGTIPGNIILMCQSCNASRGNTNLLDYVLSKFGRDRYTDYARRLGLLRDRFYEASKVRKNHSIRGQRITMYMNSDDKKKALILARELINSGVDGLVDSRGNPSISGLFRYLVQQALDGRDTP